MDIYLELPGEGGCILSVDRCKAAKNLLINFFFFCYKNYLTYNISLTFIDIDLQLFGPLKFGMMVYLYVKSFPVKITFPSGQKLQGSRTPKTTDHIFGPITMKLLFHGQLFLAKNICYLDFKAVSRPTHWVPEDPRRAPKPIGQSYGATSLKFGAKLYLYGRNLPIMVTFKSGQNLGPRGTQFGPLKLLAIFLELLILILLLN